MRSPALLVTLTTAALLSASLAPASAGSATERNRAVETARTWEMGIAACSIMSVGTQEAYGWACFKPDGDLMRVHDNRADGHMVGMRWRAGTRNGLCFHRGARGPGFESEYFVTGKHQCNKNLPESTTIVFKVGRCKVKGNDCSKLENWKNWGPRRRLAVDQDSY